MAQAMVRHPPKITCPRCKGCGLVTPDNLPWSEESVASKQEFKPSRCHLCNGEGFMDRLPKEGDLRVWAIRNPPAHPTLVDVSNTTDAKGLILTLIQADLNRPWVQANAFGLEIFEDGDWSEWEDDQGRDIMDTPILEAEA